jgi:hypothetical protein
MPVQHDRRDAHAAGDEPGEHLGGEGPSGARHLAAAAVRPAAGPRHHLRCGRRGVPQNVYASEPGSQAARRRWSRRPPAAPAGVRGERRQRRGAERARVADDEVEAAEHLLRLDELAAVAGVGDIAGDSTERHRAAERGELGGGSSESSLVPAVDDERPSPPHELRGESPPEPLRAAGDDRRRHRPLPPSRSLDKPLPGSPGLCAIEDGWNFL